MDRWEIAEYRLANQLIKTPTSAPLEKIVSHMGALQAQAYQDSLWALGLRSKSATHEDAEDAISSKRIIRTWAMRGTWHLVPPGEVRWMLSLYPEEDDIKEYQRRYHGLTESTLKKGLELIPTAFKGKESLTYNEIGAALARSGIPALKKKSAQQHIIRRAGKRGIICFTERSGGRPAFSLFERTVPKTEHLSRSRILERLAEIYFSSHGPATAADFAWWSGIRMRDARMGLEGAKRRLKKVEGDSTYWLGRNAKVKVGESAFLLPSFDEYLISYKDRNAVLDPRHYKKVAAGSTFWFKPIVVLDGIVEGTWSKTLKKDNVLIHLEPFGKITSAQRQAVELAAERYEAFIGKKVIVK